MKSLRRLSAAALVALPLAAFAQSASPADADAAMKAALETKGDARRGQAAYDDQECGTCHRRDASGRANINTPRLSAQHATVIVKQVLDIRSGLRNNPAMKPVVAEPALSLQAIADIAAYLQGLPVAGDIAKGPGDTVARGKELFDRDCAACHGAAGEGRGEAFIPMLASQHYTYLLRELTLIRDGGRGNSNPVMASLLKSHPPADLQALADYLSRLPAPTR